MLSSPFSYLWRRSDPQRSSPPPPRRAPPILEPSSSSGPPLHNADERIPGGSRRPSEEESIPVFPSSPQQPQQQQRHLTQLHRRTGGSPSPPSPHVLPETPSSSTPSRRGAPPSLLRPEPGRHRPAARRKIIPVMAGTVVLAVAWGVGFGSSWWWDHHPIPLTPSSLSTHEGPILVVADRANLPHLTTTTSSRATITATTTLNATSTTTSNHTTRPMIWFDQDPATPVVIGYAISLIKCGDGQSTADGLVDAALVLRHSIHQTSIRNPASHSRYDYRMYALVHTQAQACSPLLQQAGFEIVVRDPPLQVSDIQGHYLRRNIHRELCCGHDEFIKLYAYQLTQHEIIVHLDIDMVMTRPMDLVYDALLYRANSARGQHARQALELEHRVPNQTWPSDVGAASPLRAMMTRDWPQVLPGRKAAFQAGMLIVRPDPAMLDHIVGVIRQGDYREGFGRDNGWGGLGYGGFIGAMAMQGLLAYVYDVYYPGTWMELNHCRYNHLGMDVKHRGKCRNNLDLCEDCLITPVADLYNIHYAKCRKPWNCIGEGSRHRPDLHRTETIPEGQVQLEHCLELLAAWHAMRTDLEEQLERISGDATVQEGRRGMYKKEVFQGHCTENGNSGYLSLSGQAASYQKLAAWYGA